MSLFIISPDNGNKLTVGTEEAEIVMELKTLT